MRRLIVILAFLAAPAWADTAATAPQSTDDAPCAPGFHPVGECDCVADDRSRITLRQEPTAACLDKESERLGHKVIVKKKTGSYELGGYDPEHTAASDEAAAPGEAAAAGKSVPAKATTTRAAANGSGNGEGYEGRTLPAGSSGTNAVTTTAKFANGACTGGHRTSLVVTYSGGKPVSAVSIQESCGNTATAAAAPPAASTGTSAPAANPAPAARPVPIPSLHFNSSSSSVRFGGKSYNRLH